MATVADVMTTDVLTVSPSTPVRDVAALLYGRNISGAPVLDEAGRLVGVVSEGDLMGHVLAIGEPSRPRSWLASLTGAPGPAHDYAKAHGQTAEDVMSRTLHTITEDAPLAEVARLMERHGVKRLPVLREGTLVGIVTRRDLLRLLATSEALPPRSLDDRSIRTALLTELRRHAWAGLGSKNILVENGVVHLFGAVENEEERRALIAAAREVPGVTDVEDHLGTALHVPI